MTGRWFTGRSFLPLSIGFGVGSFDVARTHGFDEASWRCPVAAIPPTPDPAFLPLLPPPAHRMATCLLSGWLSVPRNKERKACWLCYRLGLYKGTKWHTKGRFRSRNCHDICFKNMTGPRNIFTTNCILHYMVSFLVFCFKSGSAIYNLYDVAMLFCPHPTCFLF